MNDPTYRDWKEYRRKEKDEQAAMDAKITQLNRMGRQEAINYVMTGGTVRITGSSSKYGNISFDIFMVRRGSWCRIMNPTDESLSLTADSPEDAFYTVDILWLNAGVTSYTLL